MFRIGQIVSVMLPDGLHAEGKVAGHYKDDKWFIDLPDETGELHGKVFSASDISEIPDDIYDIGTDADFDRHFEDVQNGNGYYDADGSYVAYKSETELMMEEWSAAQK